MSKYALNLDADGRILSATYEAYAVAGMPIVDILPDNDITDYKYIDGSYVYDPLPKPDPQQEEPSVEEDTLSMLVEHEERIIMLELGLTE